MSAVVIDEQIKSFDIIKTNSRYIVFLHLVYVYA